MFALRRGLKHTLAKIHQFIIEIWSVFLHHFCAILRSNRIEIQLSINCIASSFSILINVAQIACKFLTL